jgi:hypothetical protein
MRLASRAPAASGSLFPLLLATVLASSPTGYAQSAGNATLRGTVADQTGGVLRGATVTLTNRGTRAIQTSDTMHAGRTCSVASGRAPSRAIAVTAYASARGREQAIAAGYDGQVAKPVDHDTLTRDCGGRGDEDRSTIIEPSTKRGP